VNGHQHFTAVTSYARASSDMICAVAAGESLQTICGLDYGTFLSTLTTSYALRSMLSLVVE